MFMDLRLALKVCWQTHSQGLPTPWSEKEEGGKMRDPGNGVGLLAV